MIKKILMLTLLTISLLFTSTISVNAQSNTLIITDELNDVTGEEETNLSRPNVDIYQVICEQDDEEVSLSLKLAPGGVIQNSAEYSYVMGVLTTGGYAYTVSFGELIVEKNEWMVTATPLVGVGDDIELDYQVSGMNTDTVTISFDLLRSSEKCISAYAMVYEFSLSKSYVDEVYFERFYSGGNLVTDAGGPYTGEKGKAINFKGTIENENASDYNWVWMIEEPNTNTVVSVLEGVNVSYTFKIAGNYTGILYVYDSEGNFGMDDFTVDISPSTGSSGGNTGDGGIPGFEIITLIVAIAILMVILRKNRL